MRFGFALHVSLAIASCGLLLRCVGDDPATTSGAGDTPGDQDKDGSTLGNDGSTSDGDAAGGDSDGGAETGPGPRPTPSGDLLWKKVFVTGIGASGPRVTFADDGALVVAFPLTAPSLTIDGKTITRSAGASSAGASDVAVALFDKDGTLRWLRSFGGDGDDYPLAVTTDASGNVLVASAFESPTLTLDGTAIQRRAQAGGFYYYDGLLVKLRASDGAAMAHVDVGAANGTTYFHSIRRQGTNVVFGVKHTKSVVLPIGDADQTFDPITAMVGSNFVVGEWNPTTMKATWVRAFTGAVLLDVAPDEVGGLAFSANARTDARDASGAMNFPRPTGFTETAAGYAIVGSVGPSAAPRWSKVIPTDTQTKPSDVFHVAFEPGGSVLAFGRTEGKIVVDAQTIDPTNGAGSFIARLGKSTGTASQARLISNVSNSYEYPHGFAVDPWGDIALGMTTIGFSLDGVTIAGTASVGATLKLATDFGALWGRGYPQGSISTSLAYEVGVAGDGRVATIGYLEGSNVDVGDGKPLTAAPGSLVLLMRKP